MNKPALPAPPEWLANWAALNSREVEARGKNWLLRRPGKPETGFFVLMSMGREEFIGRMYGYPKDE